MARERELDLAEVSPGANPPVCRILDLGKYFYEKEKKERKAKSKRSEIKEIRLSLKIEPHDFEVKVRRGNEFLDQGHKLKVNLKLFGRENLYPGLAIEKINEYAKKVKGKLEASPTKLGNQFNAILVKDNAQTQNSQRDSEKNSQANEKR